MAGVRILAALAGVAALAGAVPASADPSVTILPLGFSVAAMRGPASRVASLVATTDSLRANRALRDEPLVVVWGEAGGAVLALKDKAVQAIPLSGGNGDLIALERGPAAIPAARIAAAGPFTVTLADETRAEGLAALGSDNHAGTLAITERRPVEPGPIPKAVPSANARVAAGPGAVFADREARIADLDRDGTPEIIAVTSGRDRGATLAVIARRADSWSIVAETPAGAPGTWLNPAAIADFAGGGRPQIALVRQPEGEAVLELWSYDGAALVKRAEKAGYSNHAAGESAQALAATLERNKGGLELAIPTIDRSAIALVSFKGGIVETARIALPAPAKTGVAVLGTGVDTHILVGLEDGRIADIRP
jgi:hypothetical protein